MSKLSDAVDTDDLSSLTRRIRKNVEAYKEAAPANRQLVADLSDLIMGYQTLVGKDVTIHSTRERIDNLAKRLTEEAEWMETYIERHKDY